MKTHLNRFDSFAESLFPTEVVHVMNHNDITDPEILSILGKLHIYVKSPEKHTGFNQKIDPRKYSRLIKYFKTKLEKIDIDTHYAWISKIDFLITTDAIPPSEQRRILNEIEYFEPTGYHFTRFYDTMVIYKSYLLIRLRGKDYHRVQTFLDEYAQDYSENKRVQEKINLLTSNFILPNKRIIENAKKEDTDWLLKVFNNEKLSHRNRYYALVVYNLYHINSKKIDAMLEPMQQLEKSLLNSDFYTRRILSNFYANKLLLENYMGNLQRAAYCGRQSIKHFTEDYLYYLNNYCSVLLKLKQFDLVLKLSNESMDIYKASQDMRRKLIFMTNYCRCLNNYVEYQKSARLAERLLNELSLSIFKYKWHYFFRIYFSALMQTNRHSDLLRIEKKHNLILKEKELECAPYLKLYTLAAEFFELKISENQLMREISLIKSTIETDARPEILQLLDEVEKLS